MKNVIQKSQKNYLILTTLSAVLFFVSIIMHNAIYAISAHYSGNAAKDDTFFFIVAVFICPTGFIVGVIGSIILLIKRKVKKKI